jgi:type IV pilus assembly protein PilW
MLGLKMMNNRKQSKGFSLVELLVAMVVGLIIVSGAFSLHSNSRKTQAVNEMQMDMVADARFALEVITYDLRHVGMYGGTNKDGLIECRSTDASCTGADAPANVTGDCAAGWSYNLSQPIFATDDSVGNPYSASCIPASEGYVAGTDVLEIRYADSNFLDPITGLEKALSSGQTYVRSNFVSGRIFTGTTQPTLSSHDSDPITHNYLLHAFAYYVSDHTDSAGDGIPSLRRVALVKGPKIQKQTLISGVSDLQVQFGEDVTGDQAIDRYVDPIDVTDWTAVYAAKIWLLMRSDKKQIGVDTTKTFSIAGAPAVSYGGQDDYRYFLVTSVVDLRNMRQL